MRAENRTPAQRRLDTVVRLAGIQGRAPALGARIVNARPANNYLKLAGGPGFTVQEVFPFDDTSTTSTELAAAAAEAARRRAHAMAKARGYDVSQKPVRVVAYRTAPGLAIAGCVGDWPAARNLA